MPKLAWFVLEVMLKVFTSSSFWRGEMKLFLHIGDSRIVSLNDIVGIFNMKSENLEGNKQFLEYATQADGIKKENLSDYKSFVVTKDKVLFSTISSQTLGKRQIK